MVDGIEVHDAQGARHVIRLICLGVKGDWPFLIEVAGLDRHFRRVPKKGQSNMRLQDGCLAIHELRYYFCDCVATTVYKNGKAVSNAYLDTLRH